MIEAVGFRAQESLLKGVGALEAGNGRWKKFKEIHVAMGQKDRVPKKPGLVKEKIDPATCGP